MEPVPFEQIGSCSLEQIQKHSGIRVEVVKDKHALALSFARTVLDTVREATTKKERAVIIMPVGPTGQWKNMVQIAAREKTDLSRLCIIQMDEYLTADATRRVAEQDPFSFTGFVRKTFAHDAVEQCGFQEKNWVVPDPADIEGVDRAINGWGGVDVAFAGIASGLTGTWRSMRRRTRANRGPMSRLRLLQPASLNWPRRLKPQTAFSALAAISAGCRGLP